MDGTVKTITPMMAQFLNIKEEYKDALLFYRMGDFYELFFEDAIVASKALGITLTKRGQHSGKDIPMCGVPAHASESYLLELITQGFKVAVCEQMESPVEAKKRGPKSVVNREVVRLVTAGTLTEESLLDSSSNNFLLAFSEIRSEGAIAWVDMSTGELTTSQCARTKLAVELSRLSPSEIIISEDIYNDINPLATEAGIVLSPLGKSSFDSSSSDRRLKKLYSVSSLDSFGTFTRAELSAMGALIDYLDITQKGRLPFLKTPVKENKEKILQIDPATRRNLEVLRNLKGEKFGSLLSTIDKTQTSPGARLLERWLSGPSTDLALIEGRLDCVSLFYKNKDLRELVQNLLKETPDLGRILSRLSIDRSGPRDLSSIRSGLVQAQHLNQLFSITDLPNLIKEKNYMLIGFSDTISLLKNALDENPPQLIKDGNFIKKGFSKSLDENRLLRDDNKKIISQLQSSYVEKTGISSLKIKYNNVLGYFIETTTNHSEKMFSQLFSDLFIHRQTTANSVRFTTVELSSLETKLLNATSAISGLEKEIFSRLRDSVLSSIVPLTYLASTLAEIDVFCSLGYLASDSEWVKPKLDHSRDFKIISGRHPVVEHSINRAGNTPFVSNSCDLSAVKDGANIWLLTGPNMSGKSTFLRQNALIAILAQIGSYVPAVEAKIGLFSQVFSRVGASDDLARGRSTFMVEMVETAAILNQADDRALVILDEIGRGTSTYDGLSIAWATLEHLHSKNKCRALFATHYHELTATSKTLESVQNATVAVKEWEGEIIFLHTVKSGSADRSYGVQVAKLAGLPSSVIKRAQFILSSLENSSRENSVTDNLPLFSTPVNYPRGIKKIDLLRVKLRNSNPDTLSPKDALQLLYELKDLQGVDETPT